MNAYLIKDGIYWVGAIDWQLRKLHGYSTEDGSTYNAYLIIDEKITLVDNVKKGFTYEMIERIKSVIDPSKIDVIISNHGEPDHSGSLPELLKLATNATVYASNPNGVKFLEAIYGTLPVPVVGVKTGDSISIGKRTLSFVQAPLVHWPDNMVTYCKEDKILYSNDIFGQHFATSRLFDYENDLPRVMKEAKKYYANIVLPYSKQANRIFETAKTLDIEIIATSHGVIWKDHIQDIYDLYEHVTNSKKLNKAVVAYDSMWGSTEKMAVAITEAFMKTGIEVHLFDLGTADHSNIITEVMDATYIALGSSTQNNTILPATAAFVTYLKGLAPVGLKYLAFGSYGWGGQSIGILEQELESMKFEKFHEAFKQHHNPTDEFLIEIENSVIQALK